MNHYQRQIILPQVGEQGQQKIAEARVLVIGAGGLGCALLPYLAAAGVGYLGIVDGDRIEESNLHRQILYTPEHLGAFKVELAKQVLQKQQPQCTITSYPEYLSGKNALELFDEYNIIVDATDRIDVRYLINDAAVLTSKPVVYGSIHRFEGQVSVFNYNGGPTYRCLFPKAVEVPSCAEAGVLGISVGIIGMLQAAEAMKIILQTGSILSGELLVYNTLTAHQEKFKFSKKESIEITQDFFEENHNKSENIQVNFKQEFLERAVLLDVRNLEEQPRIKHPSVIEIPLSELSQNKASFKPEQNYYVFCQSGQRALQAVNYLKENHINNIKPLAENATQLKNLVTPVTIIK